MKPFWDLKTSANDVLALRSLVGLACYVCMITEQLMRYVMRQQNFGANKAQEADLTEKCPVYVDGNLLYWGDMLGLIRAQLETVHTKMRDALDPDKGQTSLEMRPYVVQDEIFDGENGSKPIQMLTNGQPEIIGVMFQLMNALVLAGRHAPDPHAVSENVVTLPDPDSSTPEEFLDGLDKALRSLRDDIVDKALGDKERGTADIDAILDELLRPRPDEEYKEGDAS